MYSIGYGNNALNVKLEHAIMIYLPAKDEFNITKMHDKIKSIQNRRQKKNTLPAHAQAILNKNELKANRTITQVK